MCTVTIIKEKSDSFGIKLRHETIGPELSMVNDFVDTLSRKYKKIGGISRIAIILEPLIDSCYPDIVVLRYTTTFMRYWRDSRRFLSANDLKVLSYLLSRPSTHEELIKKLGFSTKEISKSTSKLLEGGVIHKRRETLYPLRRDLLLGLKSVDSYEAKVQSITSVHRQALYNTRFTCSSYAIVKSACPSKHTEQMFKQTGLGLLADGGNMKVVDAQIRRLPNNHVTLMFNEWIARCLAEEESF